MLSNRFASGLLQDMCGVVSNMEPLYRYPGPSYWGVAPRSVSLWEPSCNHIARMARAPTYVITTSTYAPTDPCGNNEETQAQNGQGETKNSPQAADSTTAASTKDGQSAAKNTDTCATTHRLPASKSQRLLSPMALYDPSGYFSLNPFVDQMFGELDHVFSADNERKPNFMRANVRSRVIEHDQNYSLEVEVPGFAKNEVQLHWDDATQSLRIKGESRQSL
ncbi:hypothetical protein IWQ61_008734, partial [Dispira simplex]